jgi:hypothetical protein
MTTVDVYTIWDACPTWCAGASDVTDGLRYPTGDHGPRHESPSTGTDGSAWYVELQRESIHGRQSREPLSSATTEVVIYRGDDELLRTPASEARSLARHLTHLADTADCLRFEPSGTR